MTALDRSAIVAIVGAGAMGAGIAQVAAAAGHRVKLFDAMPAVAHKSRQRIITALDGLVAKGKLASAERDEIADRIEPAETLAELSVASLVVEAIIEDLEAKRALFVELERHLTRSAILATNTSSLSVTGIARALSAPERCVGMHFFNPAPVMKLVEVVSGAATSRQVADTVFDTAVAWGKVAVHARSTPGFIVNRVARPYYAEALRLAEEGAAAPQTIDALLTDGCGFRMGPFALMDLIGHDVNYAVTCSVFDAYFQDPRYRPSLLQRELVEAGWLGRKSGRGLFSYAPDATAPVIPVEAAAPCNGVPAEADAFSVSGVLVRRTDGRLAEAQAVAIGGPVVLYDLTRAGATRMAIAASSNVDGDALASVVGAFSMRGLTVTRVADTPGLVAMRTVAMLINEAYEATLQRVASPADIDLAMCFGVNYPLGPFAWGSEIGLEKVREVLDALFASTGDPRYRASLGLRRAALIERGKTA